MLAALLMGAPVFAGTLGGGPELGTAEPWPLYRAHFLQDLEVAVAIVRAGDGALAGTVTAAEPLRVEVAVFATASLPEQPLRLHCQIQRADPQKTVSAVLWHDTCFDGKLADIATDGTMLAVDYTFTPAASDLNGTAGVVFTIWDEASDQTGMLLATYRWTGGAE